MEATATLKSMYKRLSSAAESAWAAPLFGKARDAEGTSFEAALKNPAYLPEHLEAKSQRPADPVSVVDRPLSSIGSEDSASDAPDSPHAPSEPAAEPSKLPFSLPLSLPFRLALPAGPATPHPEEQAAALPAAHPVDPEAEEPRKKKAAGLRRALVVVAAAAVLGALGARRARKQAEEQQ